MIGEGVADEVSDADRGEMHHGRSHGDPDQHVAGAVAGREGHRHDLALVAELGHEDHGGTQQKCVHRVRILSGLAGGRRPKYLDDRSTRRVQ